MEQETILINLGFVNAYLVKLKDGFVLIDTGLPSQWEQLESQLKSAKVSPKKLKLVIITHGDYDHTGNCKKLQEKYKCKIGINKNDFMMLKSGEFAKRTVRTLGSRILFFIFSLIRKFQKNMMAVQLFKPIFLKDNESMEKYGFDAKITYIPGHTKGSIAVITKEHDLFSGDTLINNKKPDYATIIENLDDLKKSVEKLKKLDARMVYPGHGKPFLMKEFLDRNISP